MLVDELSKFVGCFVGAGFAVAFVTVLLLEGVGKLLPLRIIAEQIVQQVDQIRPTHTTGTAGHDPLLRSKVLRNAWRTLALADRYAPNIDEIDVGSANA